HVDVDHGGIGRRRIERSQIRSASLEEELLAVEEGKNDPLPERKALLREHPRVLQKSCGTRSVVVRTRRGHRRRLRGGPTWLEARDRVVVGADQDPPLFRYRDRRVGERQDDLTGTR